jgi:hypothetical protein
MPRALATPVAFPAASVHETLTAVVIAFDHLMCVTFTETDWTLNAGRQGNIRNPGDLAKNHLPSGHCTDNDRHLL